MILGFLSVYAEVIEEDASLPITIILTISFLCGFLAPQGKWRWAILVGAGIPLSRWAGHWLDSTALPEEYAFQIEPLAKDFILALIGTYAGIYLYKRVFEGEDWIPFSYGLKRRSRIHEFETMVESEESDIAVRSAAMDLTAENTSEESSAASSITADHTKRYTAAHLKPETAESKTQPTGTDNKSETKLPEGEKPSALKDIEARLGIRRGDE